MMRYGFLFFAGLMFLHNILQAQQDTLQAQKWFEQARQLSIKAKYDSSNYYFKQAIPIFEKYQKWHLFYYAHIFAANNYTYQGKYDDASALSNYLISKAQKHQPREQGKYYEALGLEQKGDIASKLGNYDEAIENLNEAVGILTTNTFAGKNDVTTIFNLLGTIYREKGSLDLALDFLKKALINYKKEKNEVNMAIAQVNIASVYVMKEEYEQAIASFEEAYSILAPKLGEKHPALGTIYNNLAAAYFYDQDYMAAEPYFIKAIDLKKTQFGAMHLDVGRGIFNQGFNWEMQGKWAEAMQNYNQAIDILNILFKGKHPLLAWVLNRKGKLSEKKGEAKEALLIYEKAEQANTYLLKDKTIRYFDYIRAIETRKFKAEALFEIYRKTNAIEDLKKSLENFTQSDKIIDEARKNTLRETDKIEFAKIKNQIYEQTILINDLLFKKTKQQQYLENAFQWIEKSKALVLLETMEESNAKRFGNLPDSILQKEKEYKKSIAEYQQKLANIANNPSDEVNKPQYEEILFYTNAVYEMFVKRLEADFPRYYDLKYNLKMLPIAKMQASIDSETAILNYFVADSALYVAVLTQNSIELHQIQESKVNLQKKIKGLRNGILFKSDAVFKKNAFELYQILFSFKLKPTLKNLIIIPDNLLTNIPFEALLTKQVTDETANTQLPYLIQKFNISYAYSTNLFIKKTIQNTTAQKSVQQSFDLLALAPVFSDTQTAGISLQTRNLLQLVNQNNEKGETTRGNFFNGEAIAPLPGTDKEVRTIFEMFELNDHKAQVLIGEHAKEEFLKTQQVNKFRVLHIATHGFVNEENPELSGILLAQDSTAKEDGILYLGELYNLEIPMDLVTLSACETGLGKIIKGEGVIGLTRALLFAGAKNIVVSLWQVNDASTSTLMIDFYRNILRNLKNNKQDLSFSGAIRQAKLKMIQDAQHSLPYYWSPFILIGN